MLKLSLSSVGLFIPLLLSVSCKPQHQDQSCAEGSTCNQHNIHIHYHSGSVPSGKGMVHLIRLRKSMDWSRLFDPPPFLDSSEFFKGRQVLKSPKKALKKGPKRVQKRPKMGSHFKSGLWNQSIDLRRRIKWTIPLMPLNYTDGFPFSSCKDL